MSVKHRILDGCDVETFILCNDVEEGKTLGLRLMAELGFDDADVVSCEMGGPGVRIRLRGYVYRPSADYQWYGPEVEQDGTHA
ncbi:MAG: hypothetical protein WBL52_02960 [Bacillota bacterium]|jgi:hypothetical protein|nr:hypothetical protein [Candidatus Fermentithermobacillaceae bacterium]HAF66435.1 hypothetical protein [Clostridiales bacterium UBA9857]HOA71317.1 hypothetical protein [Bacillota bacterium]HOP70967.1 hypothetical protein [Bacillota bacterium]HPT35804.1 hypothetical protein [Bacillota bacterium]